MRAGRSRAEVVAALGCAPTEEVRLPRGGEPGLLSGRGPAVGRDGAPPRLYVTFGTEDPVLGHTLIPRGNAGHGLLGSPP